MGLRLNVDFGVEAVLARAPVDGLTAQQAVRVRWRRILTDAPASVPADRAYAARITLAAGAHEDLDLAGGLQDAFRRWIDFEELRVIWVAAAAANPEDLLLGGAGFTAPFGAADDRLRVAPGGLLLLVAPGEEQWPVVSPADTLRIANAGTSGPVTFDIVLIGASAPDLDFTVAGNPLIAILIQG